MKIGIPKERYSGETRVAASPDVVKKLVALGFKVSIEKDAGVDASFSDAVFKEAGASITKDAAALFKDVDIVFKVRPPEADEISKLKKGTILISSLNALSDSKTVEALAKAGVTAFAMEMVPRISRAQSMDILSSQSNLAGYKAVLDAAAVFGRAFPMMMTAAGTVPPARVFVMGAGVAGLQAIATAKRLGAVVTATDVRPAVKEQVESLGGKFLVVDPEAEKEAETAGGYAREMSDEYKKKQQEVVREHLKKQDVVITTALIPGRKAPVLISEDMAGEMTAGAVIVDLAVEAGGNCPLSKPDQVVTTKNGVKIVGYTNVPGRLAQDASALYAKNLLNFLTPLVDKESGKLAIDWEDEIVKGTLVTKDGRMVNPALKKDKKEIDKKGGPKKAKSETTKTSTAKTIEKKTVEAKSEEK